MFFCIIGIIVVIASDSVETYHVAVSYQSHNRVNSLIINVRQIVGFLAAGLVFTTSAVDVLVYSPVGAKEAAAAGHILLSMVAVS